MQTANKQITISPDYFLDCQETSFTVAILRLTMQMNQMKTGECIEFRSVDPDCKSFLNAWLKKSGNELLLFDDKTIKTAVIQKKGN